MDPEIADAHEEAARIRREAEAYLEATRRRADAIAEARIARLRELTDRLIATAETVDRRFGEALEVKEQLDDLVAALGTAAERVASEVLEDGAGEFEPMVIEARRTQPPPIPAPPEQLPPARLVQVLDTARAHPRTDVS